MLLGTELLFTDDKGAYYALTYISCLCNCHIPKGAHDRSKRVVHVANTEQRIAFKEVTLIPKAPKEQETSKGKYSEGTNAINLEEKETPKETYINIDRMIGLSAPASRAPRKKTATSSTSATKPKAKAKGKEKAETSKPSNEKGKEKEKEVSTEDVPMDEDAFENNNIDDIYMDE